MRWLRVVSMSIVVILTAFVLYYVLYLGSQESAQHARHLRGLGSIAGRIEGRLDNVVGVLRNAPYKLGVEECRTERNGHPADACAKPSAKLHVDSIDWLDFVDLAVVPRATLEADGELRTGTRYVPIHHGADFGLRLESVEAWEEEQGKEQGEERFVVLEAETTLERAFPRLDYEDLFDEVLIVDETGTAILQHGRHHIRFTGIDGLALVTPTATEERPNPRELAPGRGASDRLEVVIGGEPYHVYVHRLALDLQLKQQDDDRVTSKPARWLVAGLVSDDRFRSSTHVISSFSLLILIFALVLGVLMAPILKLWLLGPQERLRREDVWLFGIGSVAAVGVITIAYLDLWDYSRIRVHYADELQRVANQIDADMGEELGDLLCQMRSTSERERLAEMLDGTHYQAKLLDELTTYDDLGQLILIDRDGRQVAKLTKSKYENQQPNVTPFIRVRDREYFRGPNQGEFTKLDFAASCPIVRPEGMNAAGVDTSQQDRSIGDPEQHERFSFVLESIRSRNNDKKLVIAGIPAGHPRQCAECAKECADEECERTCAAESCQQWRCTGTSRGCAVVIGSTIFPSLRTTVLPAGFGFAITDGSGRVLFHSEPHRILEENLLAEVDDPLLLEWTARANGRNEELQSIDLRYRGAPHQMVVRELSAIDAPWRLVVFRDIEFAGRVNFKAITTSLLWFAVGLVCLCLIMWLGLLAYGSDRATWFWPREDGHTLYWPLAHTLAIIAVGFQLAMIELRGVDGLALMLCMAALGVAMTLFELERAETRGARRVRSLALVVVSIASIGLAYLLIEATRWLTWAALALPLFRVGWRLLPAAWQTYALGGPTLPRVHAIFLSRELAPGQVARSSQRGYFAVLILLVLIGGALPAVLIYWDARDAGLEDLLHMEQRSILRAMTQRSLELGEPQLLDTWIPQLARTSPDSETSTEPERWPPGVHLPRHLSLVEAASAPHESCTTPCRHDGTPYFTRRGPVVLPTDLSASMLPMQRGALPRTFERKHSADRLFEYVTYRSIHDDSSALHLVGDRDAIRAPLAPVWYGLLNGLAFVIVTAMWFSGRSFSHRLLGLGETLHPAVDARAHAALGPRRLHVHPSDSKRASVLEQAAGGWTCDLRAQSSPRWRDIWAQFESQRDASPVVIDRLELAIIDPVLGRDVLSILEKLIFDETDKRIDLLCEVELLPLLADRTGDASDGHLFSTREAERWAQLLARFDRHRERVELRALELPQEPADQVSILRRELEWDTALREAAPPLAALLGTMPTDAFQELVWQRCEPRYREIWSLCTQRDRRSLLYIAEEGFPSPDGWESVRCLEARGLVARSPDCRIVGPGFERMVRTRIPSAERHSLEGGDEPSLWSSVRTPFLLLLGLAALFLFATQRELFNIGMGAAAGAAVTIPALMRLAGSVWLGKAGSSGTA